MTTSSAANTSAALAHGDSEGQRLLLQCHRAYASLETYDGTITINAASQYGSGRSHSLSHQPMTVRFRRPQSLRFEGKDSNGDSFTIAYDGRRVVESWSTDDGGQPHVSQSIKDSLAKFSGVSSQATVVLPSILLRLSWGGMSPLLPADEMLLDFATEARYIGDLAIESDQCAEVICERTTGAWTFYVRRSDYLLRRVVFSASSNQMATQRALGGGGSSGRIDKMVDVQDYGIISKDEPIDDAAFK